MNKKSILESKVLSSFFVVLILVGVSVFIPTIQGSNVVDIIDSKNEDLTTQQIIFDESNTNKIIGSSDFEEYWSHYIKCKKAWDRVSQDSMEEFWEFLNQLATLYLPGITLAWILFSFYLGYLANVPSLSYAGISFILTIDFFILLQYIRVYILEWSWLETYSVDVAFRVCDENNTPINVYELGGDIEAYSVDAYNAIESTGQGSKEHFTYHIGPILTEGEDDIGYALSTWANLDGLNDWEKCPPPPGVWNISVTNVDGYQDTYIITPTINKADCVYLTDIILIPE